MKPEEIKSLLEEHLLWLRTDARGRRANLRRANLRRADLRQANLTGADLRQADLRQAYLTEANLTDADLRGANLTDADLRGANLRRADLTDADLSDADLTDADLRRASGISSVAAARLCITPEGAFTGWKNCRGNVIVKLQIPAEARRSNATGRKCRAEFVEVLEVFGTEAVSQHDPSVVYRVGERVVCDSWCEDRWSECAGGIHFFLTREEAEAY